MVFDRLKTTVGEHGRFNVFITTMKYCKVVSMGNTGLVGLLDNET